MLLTNAVVIIDNISTGTVALVTARSIDTQLLAWTTAAFINVYICNMTIIIVTGLVTVTPYMQLITN